MWDPKDSLRIRIQTKRMWIRIQAKKGFSTKSIFLLDPDPYNLIRIRFQGSNTDRADPDSDPQHWLPLQELQNEYSS